MSKRQDLCGENHQVQNPLIVATALGPKHQALELQEHFVVDYTAAALARRKRNKLGIVPLAVGAGFTERP